MSPSGPKMGSLGRAANHSDLVVAPGRKQRPCSSTMKRNPKRTALAEPLWTMNSTYDLSSWCPSGSAMRKTELEVAFLAKEKSSGGNRLAATRLKLSALKTEVKAEIGKRPGREATAFGASGTQGLELQRLHGGCIQRLGQSWMRSGRGRSLRACHFAGRVDHTTPKW